MTRRQWLIVVLALLAVAALGFGGVLLIMRPVS
jgi:hypothetical protein